MSCTPTSIAFFATFSNRAADSTTRLHPTINRVLAFQAGIHCFNKVFTDNVQ